MTCSIARRGTWFASIGWLTAFLLIGILAGTSVADTPLPVFHLDFSVMADVSGNEIPLEVGDGVTLSPGNGPTLTGTGTTLDAGDWIGRRGDAWSDQNQIVFNDCEALWGVSASDGAVATWIKPEDGDELNEVWNGILITGGYAADVGIEFQASGKNRSGVFGAVVGYGDNGNVFGPLYPMGDTPDTPYETWTHVAMSWESDGTATIYVNGVPGTPVQKDGLEYNIVSNWMIGGQWHSSSSPRALTGELADFALFDTSLTQADVQAVMANGVVPGTIVLPGDFDFDGDVDGADFLLWQRNTGVGALADWEANYGTLPAAGSAAAVPEPSTILLAGLCLLGLVWYGRRGR